MIRYYIAAQRTPRIDPEYRSLSEDVFVWTGDSKGPLRRQKAFITPGSACGSHMANAAHVSPYSCRRALS